MKKSAAKFRSDTLAKVWPCVIIKYGNAFTSYPIDLPGCGALGFTMEESLERLSEALTLHLLGMLEDGDEVPDPGSNGYELEDGGELVQVTPKSPNPVSLSIRAVLHETQLTRTEIANRMGSQKSVITRLADPFYFGHTVASIRSFAKATGRELDIDFPKPHRHANPGKQLQTSR